jgi:hypothetical protein
MRVWASSVVGHLMGVPPITPAEVERTSDAEADLWLSGGRQRLEPAPAV